MSEPTGLRTPPTDDDLLAAARTGDEWAFAALVARRRGELLAHCYRMLGSARDADDVLQEALARIWRGLPGFEGRIPLPAWMFRVATNACIDTLNRRPPRTLPLALGPPADPDGPLDAQATDVPWLEPFPDPVGRLVAPGPEARYEQHESLELAFVAALQHLSPHERAVLLLRDVLGFRACEVADALGTTPATADSALDRARDQVGDRLPRPSQREVVAALRGDRVRALVEGYMAAMASGDADAVVALLTEDATWAMPPVTRWYQGHGPVGRWLRREPLRLRWRHVLTRANGQPAVACYAWDPGADQYRATVLDVIALRGDRIAAITTFLDARHVVRAGLPAVLPAP